MGPAYLYNLPLEVLIRIFSWLDAVDVITLRKTCKKLQSISEEKIVWISALSRQCQSQRTTSPLLSVPKTTRKEFEDLTTRYFRLASRLRSVSSDETTFPPVRVRQLRPEKASDEICTIGLIPGGSFLATIVNHNVLQLWDLRGVEIPASPMVSLVIDDGYPLIPIAALSEDLQSIHLLCVMSISGNLEERDSVFYRVYHVNPYEETPAFESMAELHIDGGCFFCYLNEIATCAVILVPHFATVWNYRERKICTVGISTSKIDFESTVEIFVYGDLLLLWNRGKVFMYELPAFQPAEQPVKTPSLASEPIYVFSCDVASTVSAFFYTAADHTVYFDAIGIDSDRKPRIYSYKCQAASGRPVSEMITRTDDTEDDTPIIVTVPPQEENLRSFSLVLPFKTHAMLWCDNDSIHLKPLLRGENRKSLLVWESEGSDSVESHLVSLCPYSGRCCIVSDLHMSQLGDTAGRQIQVLDFT